MRQGCHNFAFFLKALFSRLESFVKRRMRLVTDRIYFHFAEEEAIHADDKRLLLI